MTRNVVFGTVFSAALAVGVAAQTTGSQQTDPQSQQSQQGQQVTVQGCLQSADIAGGTAGTSGTGTSGTTGSQQSGSGAQFMLTNAKVTSGGTGGTGTSGTSGTGTSGTSGTSSSMSDTKFKLTGGNQQELRQYVNSQVEIRGTLRQGGASSGGTGTSGSGTGSGYGTGSQQKEQSGMSDVKTLRVTSVKQISPNCSGGDR